MGDVLTNAGRAIITNRIIGAGTEPKFLGWGTGGSAAAASSTALSTESTSTSNSAGNNIRATGTSSRVTTSVTNDTHQVSGTLTADATKTITNAGVFDSDGAQTSPSAPSGGNLYVMSSFTGYVLNSGDSITFTFKLQMA